MRQRVTFDQTCDAQSSEAETRVPGGFDPIARGGLQALYAAEAWALITVLTRLDHRDDLRPMLRLREVERRLAAMRLQRQVGARLSMIRFRGCVDVVLPDPRRGRAV